MAMSASYAVDLLLTIISLAYKTDNSISMFKIIISYHIISYIDLKRQNHLEVGTDKPKLKVKSSQYQSDVRKRLLEKPRFELAAKGVFRPCYILWQGVPASRSLGQQPRMHGYGRLIA